MKTAFYNQRDSSLTPPLISTRSEVRSGAALIASARRKQQIEFISGLSDDALRGLPYLFDFWALPHQVPPEGDWKTWIVMGGRGAGKTRAGAEWVRGQVEGALPYDEGRARRVALVGETFDQARDVMVFGDSGILACSPPDRCPKWEAGRRRLVWPNGAVAQVFSAHDYEGLRGPQFDAAWVDEIGCAAIDKGTNQPNKFLDPKSSESSLPKYSSGARDDLIQMQYMRALSEYWKAPENNPVSSVYASPMITTDRMFVWAWDARPYPIFPADAESWSDGENYARGHWLNGRVTARSLAGVIAELCADAGVTDVDASGVYGLVRGYALEGGEEARAAMQPLLLAFGVDAIERDGVLSFRNRDGVANREIIETDLAWGEAPSLLNRTRAPDAEVSGRVRLTFVDADGDYEVRGSEGIFPDEATVGVARSELPLALTSGEARAVVERWLAEARVARDGVSFALPPSAELAAGDVVEIAGDSYRIDRVEEAGLKQVEGVRIERGLYRSFPSDDGFAAPKPVVAALPVWAEVMDLPLLRGDENPEAPWVVASSEPWPGAVAVYSSLGGDDWKFEAELSRRAVMGETLTDLPAAVPGLWDRGAGLEVRLVHGALASIDDTALFAGGNVAVIGAPGGDVHEVFQFRDAELISPDTWRLSHRLRGQRGSDGVMPSLWPAGSTLVVLDAAPQQLDLPPELRDLPRTYRICPASKPVDHNAFVELTHTAKAIGLKPYSPVHLRAASDGSGGHNLGWVRRGRIDGDNWNLPDVPIGEAFEAYRVQVYSGGTLRREETVTSPVWTYDAAAQSSDGVTLPFDVEIAQISDLYGPGDIARIVINA
ncbi:MAG: hypothetical protein HKN18_07905 [Silicimonas sp.]|nr:hypothetical protein [Silicimonas sp.]